MTRAARRLPLLATLAVTLGATALGCGGSASPPPPAPAGKPAATPTAGVLATVNGVAITETDLGLEKSSAHAKEEAAGDQRTAVLETIVRQELIAQRAAELGLDKDPSYLEGLRKAEAQLAAARRRGLSELFFRKELEKKAEVTPEEAKQYFAANEQKIRTEVHIQQILLRDEARIEQARKEILEGKPFEEVAAAQFPKIPEGTKPWDLGYLGWTQLPEAWRDVVATMKKGETSGVIKGPKNRFWLLQVVDSRQNAGLTVEAILPALANSLKGAKLEAVRESTDKELRARAKIVYVAPPAAAAPGRPTDE